MRSVRCLAASGLLALLPGSAAALDLSKLPSGNDHEQAHVLSEGDGAAVGIIEAPESGTLIANNVKTTPWRYTNPGAPRKANELKNVAMMVSPDTSQP